MQAIRGLRGWGKVNEQKEAYEEREQRRDESIKVGGNGIGKELALDE